MLSFLLPTMIWKENVLFANVHKCRLELSLWFRYARVSPQISKLSFYIFYSNLAQSLSLSLYFFKMGHPRPLFVCFRLFKQTLQFIQQISVKKCSSSIQCWDLNTRPYEHESPPITTGPGLPAILFLLFDGKMKESVNDGRDHKTWTSHSKNGRPKTKNG